MRVIEMSGLRFGRLVVLGRGSRGSGPEVHWFCRCDCGAEKLFSGYKIRSGHTKSCGCFSRDAVASLNLTHGHARGRKHSATYETWSAMLGRVGPSSDKAAFYFSRGIRVCERWRRFEEFVADMGERPDGRTLDRINNDGNYEPGNCRWATKTEQSRNRRNNVVLTHGGHTATVPEWAEKTGINAKALRRRVSLGWSDKEALTRPVCRVVKKEEASK